MLPIALAAHMPHGWQEQLVRLLMDFHTAYQHAPWPHYRVRPTRQQPITASTETELDAVGITTDLTADGTVVYLDSDGAVIDHPENRWIHAMTGPDPLLPEKQR